MTPRKRRDWYESELKKLEFQKRGREIIPAIEVEETYLRVFSVLAQGLRSLPDTLERKLALQPKVTAEVERIIDAEMDRLADNISSFAHTDICDVPISNE